MTADNPQKSANPNFIDFSQLNVEVDWEEYNRNRLEWDQSENAKWIQEILGIKVNRPSGHQLLVKIYGKVDSERIVSLKNSGIIIPETFSQRDAFSSRVGLVLAMGPEAYNPTRFPYGPYCRVGDYVYFARTDASLCTINEIDCALVFDDRVKTPVSEPDKFKNELQIIGF